MHLYEKILIIVFTNITIYMTRADNTALNVEGLVLMKPMSTAVESF